MKPFVDIRGHRVDFDSGVVSLEIRDSYGFVASTLQVGMKADLAFDVLKDVILGRDKDRPKIKAVAPVYHPIIFGGIMDEFGGSVTTGAASTDTVTVASRSWMALLTDGADDDDLVTEAWIDTDWSWIVAELSKDVGLVPSLVDRSDVLAGEAIEDGRWLLSVDHVRPAEVVNQAVSATGYVANVTHDKQFLFQESAVPDWYSDASFVFSHMPSKSDIVTYEHKGGDISSIVIQDDLIHIPAGAPIRIFVEDAEMLSGRYYVTEITYSLSKVETSMSLSVARELPGLKEE